MTRKQRFILILFGLLDVGVIAVLAGIVIHSTRQVSVTPTPIPMRISACEQKLLDTLAGMPTALSDAPAIAWDETQLYITLQISYPASTPPEESVQWLWTTLDSLATALRDGCAVPQTITIALTARGTTHAVNYLAQLSGQDVAAWIAGTLSETDLAARTHFRKTTQ